MTENKKKKGFRFNIIDAIVILIIIAAAVLLGIILSKGGSGIFGIKSSKVQIEYTVELKNIRDEFRSEDFIKEGDSVTDSVTLYSIGNVISVKYSPGSFSGYNSAGEAVNSEYPNHTNIVLTIRAEADISDGFYSIGGYTVAVGKEIGVRLPNFVSEGYCSSITEIDG